MTYLTGDRELLSVMLLWLLIITVVHVIIHRNRIRNVWTVHVCYPLLIIASFDINLMHPLNMVVMILTVIAGTLSLERANLCTSALSSTETKQYQSMIVGWTWATVAIIIITWLLRIALQQHL